MPRSLRYPMLALIRGLILDEFQGSSWGLLEGKACQSAVRGSRTTPQPARSLLLPSRRIVTDGFRLHPSMF